MDVVKHTPWLMPLILIGMIASVGVLRPAVQSGSEPRPMERQGEPNSSQPKAAVANKSEPAANPKDEPPSEEDKNYCAGSQNTKDCIVQVRTARATERQAKYALISLVLVGVTIALTFGTVVAGYRTVWTMQDSAEKQLRAYVFANPTNIFLGRTTLDKIHFNIRNHGQTPASGVSIVVATNVFPYPLPIGFDLGTPTHTESTQSLAPATDFPAEFPVGRALNPAVVAQLDAGTHRLYAFAVIKYKNVFGRECTTKVCASTGGAVLAQAIRVAAAGNRAGAMDVHWEYNAQHNDHD